MVELVEVMILKGNIHVRIVVAFAICSAYIMLK